MREIKFKAWVKDRKEIFEIVLINYVSKKVTYILERIGHPLNIRDGKFNDVEFNEIELMQYTGLKDEYGDEIYEGDIVTLHNSRYKVIFNMEQARFVLRDDKFEMEIPFTNNNNERMEIIGNIYENPELIED